ncbi:MAG TPA: ATP-binding protein, partial [Elusimicrobiota bacterium]|nr:ATP-binding protein [Elusimicrobiota bacterium]
DLLELARDAAESLRPLAERRRVRLSVVPGSAPGRADPGQLRQVLVNLIANAIKFNKEGGSVSVSARVRDGLVEVSVEDTGLGIPPGDLPRVFERFYRVDKARSREQGGTGLGLSIAKHLVEANGGSIAAESAEGQGSVFRFHVSAA